MSTREIGKRHSNPRADAIIGERRPLGDGGFIALHDYMGGDATILRLGGFGHVIDWGDPRPAEYKIGWLLRNKPHYFKEVTLSFFVGVRVQTELEMTLAKDAVRFFAGPNTMENQYLWTTSLNNMLYLLPSKFEHKNPIVRTFAREVCEITKVVAPFFYRAFENQILGQVVLSMAEQGALLEILNGKPIYRAITDAGLRDPAPSEKGNGSLEHDFLLKMAKMLRVDLEGTKVGLLQKVEPALEQYRQARAEKGPTQP